jgi:hypothetical protein
MSVAVIAANRLTCGFFIDISLKNRSATRAVAIAPAFKRIIGLNVKFLVEKVLNWRSRSLLNFHLDVIRAVKQRV